MASVKIPVFINVTTKDGDLIDRIDLTEYELANPIGRAEFVGRIQEAEAIALRRIVERTSRTA